MSRYVALRRLVDFNPAVPRLLRADTDKTIELLPLEAIQYFDKPLKGERRAIQQLLQGYTYIEPTDVAYAKVTPSFENGKGVVGADLDGPTFASSELTVLRPGPLIDQIFLSYVIRSRQFRSPAIGSMTGAGGLKRVDEEDMRDLKIWLPAMTEQRVIADFLDRETAEIDAFIADQERLIELLEERRAATITHAVTKGLDPNVPMKETGLEWAPLIPQHWKINKISRSFRASKGQNAAALTHEYCASIPGPYPVYSGQTEDSGVMALIDEYEFDAGKTGVLFTTTVGSEKVMSVRHLYGKFSLSQNCMIIFPIKELVIRYYYYQFQTLFEYEKGNIPQHMQASFRMSDLNQYRYLQPPSQEEHQIADYLDREMEELDAAVSDAREAIALSRERRAALISAAVTGQLDVSQAQSRGSVGEVLEEEVRV